MASRGCDAQEKIRELSVAFVPSQYPVGYSISLYAGFLGVRADVFTGTLQANLLRSAPDWPALILPFWPFHGSPRQALELFGQSRSFRFRNVKLNAIRQTGLPAMALSGTTEAFCQESVKILWMSMENLLDMGRDCRETIRY
jgi:hypothetical protein